MVNVVLRQGSHRETWLRLAPEPEGYLPRAVAALRTGDADPTATDVAVEQARIQAVILRGNAKQWLRLLQDAADLTESANARRLPDHALLIAEVIGDHHRLLIGLSRELAAATTADLNRLDRVAARLRPETEPEESS